MYGSVKRKKKDRDRREKPWRKKRFHFVHIALIITMIISSIFLIRKVELEFQPGDPGNPVITVITTGEESAAVVGSVSRDQAEVTINRNEAQAPQSTQSIDQVLSGNTTFQEPAPATHTTFNFHPHPQLASDPATPPPAHVASISDRLLGRKGLPAGVTTGSAALRGTELVGNTPWKSSMDCPARPGVKQAFLAFLGSGTVNGDGYVYGLLVVSNALKASGTERPLLVMILETTPQPDVDLLHAYGIETVVIPFVDNPNCHGGTHGRECGRSRENYSKLAAFGWGPLAQYDTFVYLDADVLPIVNVDELFCLDRFASSKTANCIRDGCQNLNSGVLVIKPDNNLYADMQANIKKINSYNKGDQGFISNYFQQKRKQYHVLDGHMYNLKTKHNDNAWCYKGFDEDLRKQAEERKRDPNYPAKVRDVPHKILHFMDEAKPWTNFNGKTYTQHRYGNNCYIHGITMWKDAYLKLWEESQALEQYVKQTKKSVFSRS